ncbi:MAG: hypothetical protein AAGH60_01885 [Pseudomonadota bacterium]
MNVAAAPVADVRRVYFQTLKRVVSGLLQVSDPVLVDMAARLDSTFSLLDRRDAGGLAVRVDRNDSGLPILADIVALARDVSAQKPPKRSAAEVKQALLDDMLGRRRMPRPLQLQEVGRAVYEEAVLGALPIFWPQAGNMQPASEGSLQRIAWDHWDGGTNSPVFTQAWLKYHEDRPFAGQIYEELASKFSGTGFTPLAAAIEFDDASDVISLKRLKRWTVGPLYSPVFMDMPVHLEPLFDGLPVDDAWMLVWHVDEVISVGTTSTRKFFVGPMKHTETYAVDTTDTLATERGASASKGHVLVPHKVHQKLMVAGGAAETLTRSMRIHSLSNDGQMFEDV